MSTQPQPHPEQNGEAQADGDLDPDPDPDPDTDTDADADAQLTRDRAGRNCIGSVETDDVCVVAFADWRASDDAIRSAIAELRLALEEGRQ